MAALIRNGRGADDPVVAKGLKYLETSVKPDGGVYDKGLANYTTCLAIMTFKEANTDGKYTKVIDNATKYVKTLQYGDLDAKDVKFGGTGYDGKSRPDLSNTQFFVEALLASGASQDDPAVKKAITFISRKERSVAVSPECNPKCVPVIGGGDLRSAGNTTLGPGSTGRACEISGGNELGAA